MLFKQIIHILLLPLIFGSAQVFANNPVVTQSQAEEFVLEEVRKDTATSLIDNIEKLSQNPNGRTLNDEEQNFIIDQITGELTGMVYKAVGFAGVQWITSPEQVSIIVKPLFKEFVKGTKSYSIHSYIKNPTLKGAGKFGAGIIIEVIQDIAKKAIKKLVYDHASESNKHIKAGAAVALVEQLFIYAFNYGNPIGILAAEAELLASRLWGIGTEGFKLYFIYANDAEHSQLRETLTGFQLEYTKRFSRSENTQKENEVILELREKLGELKDKHHSYLGSVGLVDAITGFNDFTETIEEFEAKIYHRMAMHKLSYRYIYINQEGLSERDHSNYVNNYFPVSERWYYLRIYSSENAIYSDVEVSTELHKKLYSMSLNHNVRYPNVVDGANLNPSQNISGSEFVNWLNEIELYFENIDETLYAHDYLTVLLDNGDNVSSYLTRNTVAQITDKFYQNIYGYNYAGCLLKKNFVSNKYAIRKANSYLTAEYGSGNTRDRVKNSIVRYSTLMSKKLYGNAVFNANSSAYLNYKITRGRTIEVVYDLLTNHQRNKNMMEHCNNASNQGGG